MIFRTRSLKQFLLLRLAIPGPSRVVGRSWYGPGFFMLPVPLIAILASIYLGSGLGGTAPLPPRRDS